MTNAAPRFGLETWIADGGPAGAGRIAYVGTLASRTASGERIGLEALIDADAFLAALWVPEHGFDVAIAEGADVPDDAGDRELPAFSLYGARDRPDAAMLDMVDTIVFDLQDVGARYYTYWHALKRCLEAARDAGKRIVVCERPNPLGARQGGNVLGADADAPVGCWPMAMQHGLTIAAVARYWRDANGGAVEIAPMAGWDREAGWPEDGPAWLAPSPNLPSLAAVRAYPGTCLGEGVNVSVGRGTSWPFQWFGAPWLDADSVAGRINSVRCGWIGRAQEATPTRNPYAGETCAGVVLEAEGEDSDPVCGALTAIDAIFRAHEDRARFHDSHFDALAGGAALRTGLQAGTPVPTLMAGWDHDRARAPIAPYAES